MKLSREDALGIVRDLWRLPTHEARVDALIEIWVLRRGDEHPKPIEAGQPSKPKEQNDLASRTRGRKP